MSTKIINSYIPQTRIDSFRELISEGSFSNYKKMCVWLLGEHYANGLTRYEITLITDVKEQCLTAALKSLLNEEKAFVCGVRLNKETSRYNQVYKLVSND